MNGITPINISGIQICGVNIGTFESVINIQNTSTKGAYFIGSLPWENEENVIDLIQNSGIDKHHSSNGLMDGKYPTKVWYINTKISNDEDSEKFMEIITSCIGYKNFLNVYTVNDALTVSMKNKFIYIRVWEDDYKVRKEKVKGSPWTVSMKNKLIYIRVWEDDYKVRKEKVSGVPWCEIC